jgi:hypothetical protein
MIVMELINALSEQDPYGEVVLFPNEVELDNEGEEVMLESGIGVLDGEGELNFIGGAPTVVEVDEDGNEIHTFQPVSLN